MGIENINRAKCDKCGKEKYSTLKQSAFLNKLKEEGWTGNLNKLYCSSCGEKKENDKQVAAKEYFGKIESIKKIGADYYVQVVNPAVKVYIPYIEFTPLKSNTLPSIDHIKSVCINAKQDPDKIKYHGSKKINIEDEPIYISHLCTVINKE